MLTNYLKIAWRNLIREKGFATINIGGLAVGMGMAMLISLWVWDELAFDKQNPQHTRIARVMQHQSFNGEISSQRSIPFPLGDELRRTHGQVFKYVVMASWLSPHVLSAGDKVLTKSGNYMGTQAPDLLGLTMLQGTRAGLADRHSILLAKSVAEAYFGSADPVGKLMRLDDKFDVKVTGVYADLPYNSSFRELLFIAPWELYIDNETWPEKLTNPWRANGYQTYVQLTEQADMAAVSAGIRDVKLANVHKEEVVFKPALFLQPMDRWHLYDEWKNGVNVGGQIQYVWLFSIIGGFVLLLACINFMNLSTARSEKRAREVGIRKAVGSLRGQLVGQFFSESGLVVVLAFAAALLLAQLTLPAFNQLADKRLVILWTQPLFWLLGIGFSLLTGLIAGSYPAFYLSSFQPVRVLKGTFRLGSFAAIPRKVLVVVQFTVSVTLLIGTITVFRQIQFARERPIGYDKDRLLSIPINGGDLAKRYNAVRADLLATDVVANVAESSSPTTAVWEVNNGYEWAGKDPAKQGNFATVAVSHDFGKTVGWRFTAGRDFARTFSRDSSGIVLNRAAVSFMGLKKPVGETVRVDGKPYQVIGVIDDMVMDSPYEPAFRTVFMLDYNWANLFTLRLVPTANVPDALARIEAVFKKYAPSAPFNYRFVDDEYAQKFGDAQRIGQLAFVFAGLTIFISCLGLFGLASFMAERRTKEIGVRKVLGATVLSLWGLLSREFVGLALVSFLLATPIAYYGLDSWLQQFTYRTQMAWWVFAVSGAGALLITLLTVSFQSIRAALLNPVKSLRSE